MLTWNQYPKRAPDPRWADNWEDDPARDPRKIFSFRCRLDERQKLHHGVTGEGLRLRQIIESARSGHL
jgi:hypothetical protein